MIATTLSNILKLFLPSWNFFNDFSTFLRLDVRTIHDGCESEWRPLYSTAPTPSIRRIFFNADGNAELLEKTFIDRMAENIADEDQKAVKRFESDTNILMLAGIARSRLTTTQPADQFQFRLVMASPGEAEEVLFVSAHLPAQGESQ